MGLQRLSGLGLYAYEETAESRPYPGVAGTDTNRRFRGPILGTASASRHGPLAAFLSVQKRNHTAVVAGHVTVTPQPEAGN